MSASEAQGRALSAEASALHGPPERRDQGVSGDTQREPGPRALKALEIMAWRLGLHVCRGQPSKGALHCSLYTL